eukprot:GHVT01066666.1.p1 GENE.GHVT01066666.1~~GHVT01066666.1.p1  ORF type:complete len:103 (-),score=8.28 GHVT01066666.1:55-363(-)
MGSRGIFLHSHALKLQDIMSYSSRIEIIDLVPPPPLSLVVLVVLPLFIFLVVVVSHHFPSCSNFSLFSLFVGPLYSSSASPSFSSPASSFFVSSNRIVSRLN